MAIDIFLEGVTSQIDPTPSSDDRPAHIDHASLAEPRDFVTALRSIRLALQRMRESNEQGFPAAVRDDAFAIMATATGAGCHGLAGRAARAACGRGQLPRRVLDDLERSLDAAEAASAAGSDSNPAAPGAAHQT